MKNTLSWLRQNYALAAICAIVGFILLVILVGLVNNALRPSYSDYFACRQTHSAFDCRDYQP